MAWDDEEVLEIVERLGPEAALWLLSLSNVRGVGTNRARNYKVFPGKIKSTAKNLGVDVPEGNDIRDGFNRLKRVAIALPDGSRDSVILGDKPDYVKLTDHGLTLVTLIDSKPEIERSVKQFIGADIEEDGEEGWWPNSVPPEAPVQLTAISEETDERPCELEVEAEFSCPHTDCRESICHSYSMIYPNEAWTKDVEITCQNCGQKWRHKAGDPWEAPEGIT